MKYQLKKNIQQKLKAVYEAVIEFIKYYNEYIKNDIKHVPF